MVPEHGPTWVGRTEVDDLAGLQVEPGYRHARLLVTAGGDALGEITVGLRRGVADAVGRAEAVRLQIGPVHARRSVPSSDEPLTVVVPTRRRPEGLLRTVRSVLAGDHPAVTVLVVDHDPADDRTRLAVDALADPRVYYLRDTCRGAAAARNRGLVAATTGIVAFTDDDTEVDPGWARRVAGAFLDPQVAGMTGPVLAARLDLDQERVADLARPRAQFRPRRIALEGTALLPLSRSLLGAGSNMAVRADVARAVGGFDEALGPGGDDAEFLVRLVLGGHVVAHEPAAWVRHHHATDGEQVRALAEARAAGLAGVVTKVLLSAPGRAALLRRVPGALRSTLPLEMPRTALVSGPLRYLWARGRARRSGGRVPPLAVPVGGRHPEPATVWPAHLPGA
ncbi:glycosyltransferase family 2 protein [Pseudonocardia sp. WMMC193]|uniref:glycosyltransferase family 2 protein n=1 Tax=Pseudonocardia sp. WMMC193 TaxID=2911965 RepID=UPI001F215914|nr:glycosyltransferase [Pseudonocardia sp. WMMC193]MCF7553364.1 glycosyltransferase family 2 protein [Pseudonocardia sp. WMMC193]